jgi:ketosteroid isomerase-like protein
MGPMTSDEIEQLADRFLEAITRGDVGEVASIYADDVLIWHNFDQLEQGREQNIATLAALCERLVAMRYEDVRRVVLDDGFIQQHVLRGTTRKDVAVEIPAMMRVWCANGQVVRIEEYLDRSQAAPVFA